MYFYLARLIVSHYLLAIYCEKNYNYMFEFVKVMPKVLSVHFFPGTVYWFLSCSR